VGQCNVKQCIERQCTSVPGSEEAWDCRCTHSRLDDVVDGAQAFRSCGPKNEPSGLGRGGESFCRLEK
jgi:hypothetical protein